MPGPNSIMFSDELKKKIRSYKDFPTKNILFRDITPILRDPKVFSELIKQMSERALIRNAECIVALWPVCCSSRE